MTSSRATLKTKTLEAELAIIGGGGAGLAAAAAAAENGITDIITLEKRGSTGGNSAMAFGLFACESPVQKREAVIAGRDELFKKFVDWAHWGRIDPRIVRAFIDKSGDTIRWLEARGVPFILTPMWPNQVPAVWHCPPGRGAQLMKALARNCRDQGVQVLTRTSANKILFDSKGNVSGVLAVKEKKEFAIRARSVIIATGGFGGNKELLKKYCPSYYDGMPRHGLPLMGDGLFLASEAGVALEGFASLGKEGPTTEVYQATLMALLKEPATVWVNKRGQRFVDEFAGFNAWVSGNAVLCQPDKVSYTLFDSAIRRNFEETGITIGRGKNRVEQRTRMPGLEEELQAEAGKDMIKIAGSWDGIARWIGAEPHILKDTIDGYNACCERGYDAIFNKDRKYLVPLRTPPYYAIRGVVTYCDTFGGIRINEHMEALDSQDKPVPGLYVAGVIASGWEPETYCSELTGSAFGFAVNSGRIAGENAAGFISGKSG